MAGALREITGTLVGQTYPPAGPWADVGPTVPKAMRRFDLQGAVMTARNRTPDVRQNG